MVESLANDFESNHSLRRRWFNNSIFFLLLVVLFASHTIVFLHSNPIIDSDQPFLWIGVKDYAEGKFYEPRFYGQDYNTFLESLVAVPFYKMGVPVYYALPLATHLLFLCPVLFTVFYLFRKGRKTNAIVALAIFDCLTTAFDIMSSLPRGFVTGIFFTTFFVISCCYPRSLKAILLNSVMLCIGLFVNPNIIVAAVPLYVFLLLHNYRVPKFYLCGLFCLFLLYPLYLVFDRFYDQHPEFVIYDVVHSYSAEYFMQNINHLDQCFAHVSFFFEDNCITLLVVLFVFGIVTFRQSKLVFATFLIYLFFIVLTFFVGKTREGSHWPFYSFSRMYLGLPFALCYFIAMLRVRKDSLFSLAVIFTLVFSVFKLFKMKDQIAYHTNPDHAIGVRIIPQETVLRNIKIYKSACDKFQAKRLVISSTFWLSTYLNYGGPTVDHTFPPTEESFVDRRYWVREFQKDSVCDRFILISVNYDFDKKVRNKYPFEIERIDDYGQFLIKNNKLSNINILYLLRHYEKGS